MEYLKRVHMSELNGMSWEEKEKVSERVIGITKGEVNEIIKINSLARKLEIFIRHASTDSLGLLLENLKILDVHNKNITYALESILKRIEDHKILTDAYKSLVEKVSKLVCKNITKSLRSKGTNHIIRALLRIDHKSEGLKDEMKALPMGHFLEESTRSATYAEYLVRAESSERERVVAYLVESMRVENVKNYNSFLYEIACRFASREQLDKMYAVIRPVLMDICKDPVGNYFMQAFVSAFSAQTVYAEIEGEVHTFQANNNVLHKLLIRAAEEGAVHVLESAVKRVFRQDQLMHTLLFHGADGFDSKSYKLGVKYLQVPTRYREEMQVQCLGLYEAFWVRNRIGQEIIVELLRSGLGTELKTLFLSTLCRDLVGIKEARGGEKVLDAMWKVADAGVRRKISAVRSRE
ncbi:uncharacterized protein NEMAJ01_0487 [Nematocida major]|uniref:uncharacterized protein n=1 Tax=Nematocida major TaxID=1912982 RepID=UPI00200756C8|nr:uncharacterized protein NEMAJ01_0487 [Nematocida major]KAH9385591.1 hypothetical protein NEMAJ01_0487 [Nematocida major]